MIRDRVKELRRVRAADLRPCPLNWRTHPKVQRDALQALLAEIGYASALLARELPDGSLELIDGHLRAETTPDMEVPVLILDVDADEARKLLATHDPLAALAGADADKVEALLRDVRTESPAVEQLLAGLAERAGALPDVKPLDDLPHLEASGQHTITLRYTDADEPALRRFVGQDDNLPLEPVCTGRRILERIKAIAAD